MMNNYNLLKYKCIAHPKQSYVGICMNKKCQAKKLVCAKCLVFFHSNHHLSILFLTDLLNLNMQKNSYKSWDIENSLQKKYLQIQKRLGIDVQFETKMNEVKNIIYESIDRCKSQLRLIIRKRLQEFKIQEKKNEIINKLGTQISQLQKYLNSYFNNSLNLTQLNLKLQKIVQSRQIIEKNIKLKYQNLSSNIDQDQFIDIIIDMQKHLNLILLLLDRPQTKLWSIGQNLTSKQINILKQGRIFNFQNENRNQIIYGQVLKKNTTIKILFELLEEDHHYCKQQFQNMNKKQKVQKKKNIRCVSQQMSQQQQFQQEKVSSQKDQNESRLWIQPIVPSGMISVDQVKNIGKFAQILNNIIVGIMIFPYQSTQDNICEYIIDQKIDSFNTSKCIYSYDLITGKKKQLNAIVVPYHNNGNLNTIFLNQIKNSESFQLLLKFNPKNNYLQISDITQKSNIQFINCILNQQNCQFKPFVLCNKSRIRVTIKSIQTDQLKQTFPTILHSPNHYSTSLFPPPGRYFTD